MADDDAGGAARQQPRRRASDVDGKDGLRPLVFYDLQLLMSDFNARFDRMEDTYLEAKSAGEAMQVQVNANAAEIKRVHDEFTEERSRQRNNVHDMNNEQQKDRLAITVLAAKISDNDLAYIKAAREAAEKQAQWQETMTLTTTQKVRENVLTFLMVSIPTAVIVAVISIIVARYLH